MAEQAQNNLIENPKINKALRKIYNILQQKIVERQQHFWHRLKFIHVIKSPQFLTLKGNQFWKRLSRIYTIKLKTYFTLLFVTGHRSSLQKIQQKLNNIKTKDRIYEAKVKSLRVLSRQWKQKKTQNDYKNKYFTPKIGQTSKQLKSKYTPNVYAVLRNIVRNKYLQVFNRIKSSEVIKIRNAKALYLVNYLLHKRKYWLTYGIEKLKLNTLVNREIKNHQEIAELDKKSVPVQDAQIQSIKEKQEKLQLTLNNVLKQKQTVEMEVNKQIEDINDSIDSKNKEINELKKKKQYLAREIQRHRQFTTNYSFSKDQIYYLIYMNFLINVKLWSEFQTKEKANIQISKQLVLQWLQTPTLDFHLDTIQLAQQGKLQQQIVNLQQLFSHYKRLRSNQVGDSQSTLPLQQIFELHFSNNSINLSTNSLQQFLTKNKYTYKILSELLKENQQVMYTMLSKLSMEFQKINGDTEIIENI